MNTKRSTYRGFGFYLLLILAVIAIWYWLDGSSATNTYTRAEFEIALQTDQIASIQVIQNREIPTGSLEITFKDASTKVLVVSDVQEMEQYLQENGFLKYVVQNPPEESWLVAILPYLIIFAAAR